VTAAIANWGHPMRSDMEALAELLDQSRRRLAGGQVAILDTLATLDRAVKTVWDLAPLAEGPGNITRILEGHRERLIEGVLTTLDSAAPQSRLRSLALDPSGKYFQIGDRRLALTASEQTILRLLWENDGEPVSREALAEALYGKPVIANPRAIDVFVSHLRRKLRIAGDGWEPIESVRGRGWQLVPEAFGERR
jgi:DNA-binding response OmpR family regulator